MSMWITTVNFAGIIRDSQAKINPFFQGCDAFINVGTTTLLMLVFSYLPLGHFLLASTFIGLTMIMVIWVARFK